jgi:hypothetical protein
MKKLVVALVMALAVAGSVSLLAGDQDFVLVNKTGLTIDELYVSPTTVNDWEEDVLGVDVLEDGEKAEISFDREETACDWDLKIVDEDGDEVVWKKINLCKASEITLRYDNGRPTATIK